MIKNTISNLKHEISQLETEKTELMCEINTIATEWKLNNSYDRSIEDKWYINNPILYSSSETTNM